VLEWDEAKREANLVKHGVDFVDALEVLIRFASSGSISGDSTPRRDGRLSARFVAKCSSWCTPSGVRCGA